MYERAQTDIKNSEINGLILEHTTTFSMHTARLILGETTLFTLEANNTGIEIEKRVNELVRSFCDGYSRGWNAHIAHKSSKAGVK